MKKLIKPGGVVVNRILLCHNPHCPGIIQTREGPAAVKIGQQHYSHAKPPSCPDCGIPMVIESVHAVRSGHIRKADEHKTMDHIQAEVFGRAEATGHRLAENAREGDAARFVPDAAAAQYLKETEEMAKQKGLHTGFANGNFQSHRKMVRGVAADSTFARQTVSDGAMLPMAALARATGNPGFNNAGGDGKASISTGGHQFWRHPTGSSKVR